MSGAGRLTIARIDTIQSFYGLCIRQNKGDSKAMAKATKAIMYHYASTEENPQHTFCPVGKDSSCSYQRDVANNTKLHKPIKNPFPPAIIEVIKPLFDRLGDANFLAGCERCATQNPNESLHHVIWGLAPKEQYTSPRETGLAVGLGCLLFKGWMLMRKWSMNGRKSTRKEYTPQSTRRNHPLRNEERNTKGKGQKKLMHLYIKRVFSTSHKNSMLTVGKVKER